MLDVGLPGLDGLGVCRRLRGKGLAMPILLLTARDAIADRVNGLDAGADDYLVKPFAAEELLARARALLRRGVVPDEVLAFDDLVFDVRNRTACRGRTELPLSAREADLLELLLRNPRQVVSRSQALEHVWGGVAAATLNVVDRYVSYLRRKLGDPPLIQTVRGVGFMLGAMIPRSLGVRSIVAASLAILLALVVVGVGVDILIGSHLHHSLDRSLRERAVVVAQLSASAPALITAPGALDASLGGQQISVEVVDRRGRIVARSLALGGRVLPVQPLLRKAIADGIGRYANAEFGTEDLRVYAAPLADAGGPAAGGAVAVAASTHELDDDARERAPARARGGACGGRSSALPLSRC